ncbi:hypothetical protein KBY82_02925 [Cyanobium sp. AMD-g]|uniref:DUF2518 family protein n=1 Tax=Cyanobium sp. AMD-g TaxID=2823699 RepID=UPI0020CF3D53|nr:DUF2518 family protein [Cyanobium sp. AMD-g]MCP9929731.1 hypothetical protein [Cyanobium sp. AMD-g]
MAADPILLVAGTWLGAASGVLAVLTIAGFLSRWGIRFRLVGITSFTALLSLSCLAFSISYNPRVSVPGAVQVPVVFDNGTDLVIAAAPADLPSEAAAATVEQVARNLRGGGRGGSGGGGSEVRVRLRRVEAVEPGLARPVVLAETTRQEATSSLDDAV